MISWSQGRETALSSLVSEEKDPVKGAALKTKVNKTAKELKTAILYRGSILSLLVQKKKEDTMVQSPQDKRQKVGEHFPRAGGHGAEDKDSNYIDLVNSPVRKGAITSKYNNTMDDTDSRTRIGNSCG